MRRAAVLALLVAAIAACRSGPRYTSGYLGNYSELTKSERHEDTWAWRRPGIDFTEYDRFVIEPVLIDISPESQAKDLGPAALRQVAEALREGLVATIEPYYDVVRRGAPHALRVQVILTHVKMAGSGEPGEIAVEAEVVDSVTGTRLGTAATYLEWSEADGLRSVCDDWGMRLVHLVNG